MYLNLLPFSILCTVVLAELTSVSKVSEKFKLVCAVQTSCAVQTFHQRNVLYQDVRDLVKGSGYPGSMVYIMRGKALRLRRPSSWVF